MNTSRVLGALLLAGALLGSVAPVSALAQVASTHEVRKGDTLFGIARKARHDGVSRNQMFLAIWRANRDAFPGGNINLLDVGTVLTIPARDAVAAIEPAEADRQVRELLAPPPPVAAIRPAPALKTPAKPGAAAPAGRENAARRYRDGLALERKRDDQGALTAFLESGEAGYGLAQRKLGQIYDKGNRVVQRDYQASLRWYQKAREQGVQIDKPLPRMTTK